MVTRKIGGLPVVDHAGKVVGVITETDIFKALLELLGGRQPGVRVTVSASGDRGTMAKITGAIVAAGGNIVGLGCREIRPASGAQWEMVFKVQDVPADQLVEALRPVVVSILDVRETGAPS
jgi:acetoin utilization protein AcuB